MIEIKVEIKDEERGKKIFQEFANGKFDTNQFQAKLMEIIDTITDERDAYIEAIKEKEKSMSDD